MSTNREPGFNPTEKTWAGYQEMIKMVFDSHKEQLGEVTMGLLTEDWRGKLGYSKETVIIEDFPNINIIKETTDGCIRTTQIELDESVVTVNLVETTSDPNKAHQNFESNYPLSVKTTVAPDGSMDHSLRGTLGRVFLREQNKAPLIKNTNFYNKASEYGLEHVTQIIEVNKSGVVSSKLEAGKNKMDKAKKMVYLDEQGKTTTLDKADRAYLINFYNSTKLTEKNGVIKEPKNEIQVDFVPTVIKR